MPVNSTANHSTSRRRLGGLRRGGQRNSGRGTIYDRLSPAVMSFQPGRPFYDDGPSASSRARGGPNRPRAFQLATSPARPSSVRARTPHAYARPFPPTDHYRPTTDRPTGRGHRNRMGTRSTLGWRTMRRRNRRTFVRASMNRGRATGSAGGEL